MVDKKQLEKTLLLSYMCNAEAGERTGGQQVPRGPEGLFQGGTFPLASGSADLIFALWCNERVWMTSLLAEYQQGFCETLLRFHLLVEREHEVYWLFQFFIQKTVSFGVLLPWIKQSRW